MNVLDWVLVGLALAYAFSGYWQGFIAGSFATAGLLIGGLVGIWAAPQLLADLDPSLWVSIGALLVVLVAALVGQGVFSFVGARLRNHLTWRPARVLDAAGGAALSAAAVLVVAWALGVALSGSSLPVVSAQVRSSVVLSKVDTAMPQQADRALRQFNDVVGASFFPRYLEPFAPERIPRVAAPPPRVAQDPDVARARASVVKIHGRSSCGRGLEGSGFVYGPGRVMTNAHVVAGVDHPTVVADDRQWDATVVLYNPDLDIAVLEVPGLDRARLEFDMTADPRDKAAVLGYPGDGPYRVDPARIRSEQRLRSPDIYGEGTVVREVYSLRANVRPGNSGGPLVSTDGEVLGVVFAASVTDANTGYALTAEQVAASAAKGLTRDDPVSTGTCT